MIEENLNKQWEEKMTTGERIIWITILISDAQDEILKEDNDSQRIVGCFERTGCIITKIVTQESDSKIKLQGGDCCLQGSSLNCH